MSEPQVGRRRRIWPWIALSLAVLLVAGVSGGYAVVSSGLLATESGDGGADSSDAATAKDSAQQRRPAAAEPSDPARPAVLPAPKTKRSVTTTGVRQALQGLVGSKDLGRRVGIAVRDADSGKLVYQRGGDHALTPASTTKLVTAVSVLAELGPSHRFRTSVVRGPSEAAGGPGGGKGDGGRDQGPEDGAADGEGSDSDTDEPKKPPHGSKSPDTPAPAELTLVGGGDPMLATAKAKRKATGTTAASDAYPMRASVEDLARRTAGQLKRDGTDVVRLSFDDTRFAEAQNAHWEDQYIPTGVAAPVSALWVDQARTNFPWQSPRADDPAAHAADEFAAALDRHGISVRGDPFRRQAPKRAENVAKVRSAPLDEIVEHTLLTSDNDAAEVLARQVAVARDRAPTAAGAATAIRHTLADLDVALQGKLYDGSGLSRDNRLTAAYLSELVRLASSPDHPDLRAVLTGLPVAGFDGTLAERYLYEAEPGRGHVRGKTGTLTGISSLSGVVTTKDGQVLTYAVLVNGTGDAAQPGIDRVTAALANCGCAAS